MHVHSVANVAVDRSAEVGRGPGLALSAVPRPRCHWCPQHERRHGRPDARADQVGQAPAGRGGAARATPVPHRGPFDRWRSSLGEQPGRRAHGGGGAGRGGAAGLEWRGPGQGVREPLARGLLRDHGRGASQGNPRGRPCPVPHHTRGGGRGRPAHGRASGRVGGGVRDRRRRRAGTVRPSSFRLRQPPRTRAVPGDVPAHSRTLRQPESRHLQLGHRGVPPAWRGLHRRPGRLPPRRVRGSGPFGYGRHATRPRDAPPQLGRLVQVRGGSGASVDPAADRAPRAGERPSR